MFEAAKKREKSENVKMWKCGECENAFEKQKVKILKASSVKHHFLLSLAFEKTFLMSRRNDLQLVAKSLSLTASSPQINTKNY
ncbi:MAG: hypothetical protein QM726_14895 [Chitinophagaceae bacterium]